MKMQCSEANLLYFSVAAVDHCHPSFSRPILTVIVILFLPLCCSVNGKIHQQEKRTHDHIRHLNFFLFFFFFTLQQPSGNEIQYRE